ncbi:hypothetical protein BB559_003275 [Furculomyces boomerangus]|uniref:Uncharacterized protein n=1 Tax=Furculomyces boomerangus TaxID=61424 RepID=A0A2T9YMB4_9FUNG|nr:hypothetical protein BB559_003275 [Furculomyces boomerangus]
MSNFRPTGSINFNTPDSNSNSFGNQNNTQRPPQLPNRPGPDPQQGNPNFPGPNQRPPNRPGPGSGPGPQQGNPNFPGPNQQPPNRPGPGPQQGFPGLPDPNRDNPAVGSGPTMYSMPPAPGFPDPGFGFNYESDRQNNYGGGMPLPSFGGYNSDYGNPMGMPGGGRPAEIGFSIGGFGGPPPPQGYNYNSPPNVGPGRQQFDPGFNYGGNDYPPYDPYSSRPPPMGPSAPIPGSFGAPSNTNPSSYNNTGYNPYGNIPPRPTRPVASGVPPSTNAPQNTSNSSGMEWIPVKNSLIPSSAFVAGKNRNELVYIIRSSYKNGVHVGTLSKGIGGAMITAGGRIVTPKEYSILCANENAFKWVPAKGRVDPTLVTHRLVLGGNDPTGSPFFVAKRTKNGRDYIGKVGPSIKQGISYPYEGSEKVSKEYQMLAFR